MSLIQQLVLGDTEIPWLNQDNDYKPAKEGQEYLRDKKIGKHFSGALKVEISGLPTFVKHLAWLIRRNAVLPYFHFVDERQNVIGSICHYGNLHLDILHEQTDNSIRPFVDSTKFEYGDKNNCHNLFSKTNAIPGRQIIL